MNQKGFANVIVIVLVVILAGVVGYFVLTQKSETPSTPQEQQGGTVDQKVSPPAGSPQDSSKAVGGGPTTPSVQQKNLVIAPNGGEKLQKGSTYAIRWNAPSNFKDMSIVISNGFCPKGETCPGVVPPVVSYTISLVPNTGSYSWNVGSVSPTSFYDPAQGKAVTVKEVWAGEWVISIFDVEDKIIDFSDKPFSITE